MIMAINVTFASSAPSSAVQAIRAHFHLSAEVSYLITFTFLMGNVLGHSSGAQEVNSSVDVPSYSWLCPYMYFTAIFLPETYAPVILLRKVKERRRANPEGSKRLYAAHEKQDWSPWGIVKRTLFRPFIMLSQELILVLVTIYLSLIYGVMYMLFEAFPIIFVEKHGFTISQNGLVFIGVGIGTVLGALSTHFLATDYPQLIKVWRGFPPPEERLRAAMLGSPVFVIGIFWLGWTGEYTVVPWYVPAISSIPVGFGISAIIMSFLSYLLDTYVVYAASAFAANTFARSLVAAGFQLFTVQMFEKLSVGYACTLLAGVGLLLAPMPFLFFRYGARVREGSRWAPGMDLQVKKQLEEEKFGVAVRGA